MENTQDFLNKLDKLTFIKHEDKTMHTAEGFQISYSLELLGVSMPNMPIQFQFRVRKEGRYVMTWGCDSNESVLLSVRWWQKKEFDIHISESDKESDKRKALRKEFETLTK